MSQFGNPSDPEFIADKKTSPGFNEKIISKGYNFVSDYFELRAQPGESGEVFVLKGEKFPVPSVMNITRTNGLISQIVITNVYGVKTATFSYVDGLIDSISIDNYGTTQRTITFVRTSGLITQINTSQ